MGLFLYFVIVINTSFLNIQVSLQKWRKELRQCRPKSKPKQRASAWGLRTKLVSNRVWCGKRWRRNESSLVVSLINKFVADLVYCLSSTGDTARRTVTQQEQRQWQESRKVETPRLRSSGRGPSGPHRLNLAPIQKTSSSQRGPRSSWRQTGAKWAH